MSAEGIEDFDEDDVKDKSVDELIKAITDCQGQYAFLIGAGTSKPAGIPTAGDLISEWQEEAHQLWAPDRDKEEWIEEKEEEIGPDQNRYGFWFEQVHATKEQRREYIENEVVADADPEFGHIVLASMMADDHGAKYVPLTFTPNFDDLLYDAFYHFIEERPMLVHHNALATEFSITDETPTIVKVHGDYLYQNLKNLDDETRDLEEDIEDRIVQVIGEFGLVVIGYGGRDDSIMEPLIRATRSGEGVFWCVRESDELSDYAKELLQQPNTFRVEIEGSEELFSKFFARIDGLQTPQADDLMERADRRAEALSEKREEARKHATEEDQEVFELTDRLDKARSYKKDGEYRDARKILEEIIENEPEGTEISPEYVQARFLLSSILRSHFEEFEEAREHLKRVIETNFHQGRAHDELGLLLQNEFNQYNKARQHFERAIELDPNHPAWYYDLGRLLKDEFEEYSPAGTCFERAIEIYPEFGDAHYMYAELLEEEFDEPEKAEKHYKKAAEVDPEYVYE